MPHYDFRTPRVYLDAPLAGGQEVAFDRDQANYLRNVLRLGHGDERAAVQWPRRRMAGGASPAPASGR